MKIEVYSFDKLLASVETDMPTSKYETFEQRVRSRELSIRQKLERLSSSKAIQYKKHYFVITIPSKMNKKTRVELTEEIKTKAA